VSGALDALHAAMATGDVDALARTYARNAVLQASLPGGRVRRDGRAAIVAELGAWWEGPEEVDEWRAEQWPAGAALTASRAGVRRRHYLHLSGDLIARHWVYAMAPASLGGGNSGAQLERVTLPDGTPGIAKRVVPGGDWLGRVAGGRAITAELWRAGVLQRLPASIETGIVAVEPEGDGWRIVMRDLSAGLLPAQGPISRARHREVMAAAGALHATFRGERFDGAITLEGHLAISSPAVAEAERDGSDVIPKQLETAWEAFADVADDDVAQAVLANLADPGPLARALRTGGTTLVHGDLRDDNLGFVDGRVVLLDWDIAGEGTPALEVAWYLCHDAWRTEGTHDELLEDFLIAEGGAVSAQDLDLGLIAGLQLYGWIFGHSALIHPNPAERAWAREELGWWVPRVRAALERTGAAA
jgi:Ser/Thr protein kinase RdoA (MazF antagonist)